ncbi:MAG: site-2 protease family protein [Gemmataceae bacterium]|nr:site-2 protease family protein [Gemmataceae bacterium]
MLQSGSSPFDLRWRMFGIPVRVQWTFWLVAILFGLQYLLNKRYGLFAAWVACMFVSLLFKELGHVLVGRIFGVRGGVILYAFGGTPVGPYETMPRWQRILFHAAGPAMSFALWYGAWAWLRYANLAQWGNAEIPMRRFLTLMTFLNLLWGIIHLLPIHPLDGGKIIREVCEGILGRSGLILSLLLSLACALGLGAYSVYALVNPNIWHWGFPILSLIFDAMLLFGNVRELVQVLRERPPTSEDEPRLDSDRQAAQEENYDNYRPFDGGRPSDLERR